MLARVDNVVRDVLNISKDIQDIKASLQFDISDLQSSQMINSGKISTSLASYQVSMNNLSAKNDYLENQTRRNNLLIDGVPESKTESWGDTEIVTKKVLSEHLKMDSKLIEVKRAHRSGKYDLSGRPRSTAVKLLRYKDKQEILKRSKLLKGTNIFIN